MNKTIKHNYYVYIMASYSGTLYIGVTNDLINRVIQQKQSEIKGFTQKYKCNRLVHYEHWININDAIQREKQLKKWNRNKKEQLIKKQNPHWQDLSDEFLK